MLFSTPILLSDTRNRYGVVEVQKNDSTKRKTESDMHLLRDYLEEVGETRDIELIPVKELDVHFGNFLLNVRKIKDGSQYGPSTMVGFMSSFNRYLRSKGISYQVNKNVEFQYSSVALRTKLSQLKALGLGAKLTNEENKELTEQDIEKLFQVGEVGLHKPDALINFLYISIMYVLGIKHRTELRNLNWGDIQMYVYDDGLEYLAHVKDHKSNRGSRDLVIPGIGLRNLKPKIYSNVNKLQCPVEAYKLYASKRPNSMADPHSPFFLAVSWKTPSADQEWFKAQPMGKNRLCSLIKNLIRKSRL